jgi:hypothetical protein
MLNQSSWGCARAEDSLALGIISSDSVIWMM